MRICFIVGTRPEIIKMAPVIRECQKRSIPFLIIHSNQHYSEDMDSIFFDELELPVPDYNLGVGSGQHSNQTGNILIKIEPIMLEEKPDIVLAQGDTNTVLAGALAASKLNIKVGHIEAGLRSYDRMMPEETNRVLTDHMSHYLFAVSSNQKKILLDEGIAASQIHTVGNTVSDSLFQHKEIAENNSSILSDLSIDAGEYFLVTVHRASNVDIKEHLLEVMHLFNELHSHYSNPIVWPIHPRTKAKLTQYNVATPSYLKLISPVGYLDFIKLQKNAMLILTDSGGIQEEACLLGVPCITLRENTERPETIEVGANVLVGRDTEKMLVAAEKWLSASSYSWKNPFGDGHVAKEIIDIITHEDDEEVSSELIRQSETVAVIGMGYMGLPIACLLANAGFNVTGVDLNAEKVDEINKASCPFDEKGMSESLTKVVDSGFLIATTSIPSSDYYLVAVPTPHSNKKCDLSYVLSAIDDIAKVAKDSQTVIIESTISPGTSIEIAERFSNAGLNINIVHCPERAIPGQTLHELVHNDRIIGAEHTKCAEKVKTIYRSFVKGEIFLTDLTTAECVKLVENTSRDVGIALANELAQVCEELKVDVFEVIKLANRHPRVNILTPGPGVGGHCIPIDPWFLVEKTQAGKLIRLSRAINDQRPMIFAEKALKLLKENKGNKVGLLGVAYKPNVDDCRETPAEPLLNHLKAAGVTVKYHDPHVTTWCCEKIESITDMANWADLLILVSEHDCYKSLDIELPLIDTRGCVH